MMEMHGKVLVCFAASTQATGGEYHTGKCLPYLMYEFRSSELRHAVFACVGLDEQWRDKVACCRQVSSYLCCCCQQPVTPEHLRHR